MKDKKWTVYCHTNKINNKKYVGITSQNPICRWANGNGYKGSKFYNAIQKYGWDNFEHEVLFEFETEEEADEMEIKLIKDWNLTNDEFGYNVSLGGAKTTFGLKYSEETKRKLSEQRKGIKKPENKGSNNPMASRVIYKNKIYGSVVDLAEEINEKPTKIYDYLSGNVYIPFEYYEDGLKWYDKTDKRKVKIPKIFYKNRYYYTFVDFEKEHGVSRHRLSSWYIGKNSVPRNFIDEGFVFCSKDIKISNKNKIIFLQDKRFDSLKEFSKYCGITESKISKWLDGTVEMPQIYKDLNLREYK